MENRVTKRNGAHPLTPGLTTLVIKYQTASCKLKQFNKSLRVGSSNNLGEKLKGLGENGKKSLHGTYCVWIPLRCKLRPSDWIDLDVDDA